MQYKIRLTNELEKYIIKKRVARSAETTVKSLQWLIKKRKTHDYEGEALAIAENNAKLHRFSKRRNTYVRLRGKYTRRKYGEEILDDSERQRRLQNRDKILWEIKRLRAMQNWRNSKHTR